MSKIRRWWLVSLLPCLGLAVLYFTPGQWQTQKQGRCEVKVCVSSTGVHADLILPVQAGSFDWRKTLAISELSADRQPRYLSIGWGDREFYRSTPSWSDLKITSALRALFGSNNPSVMHVQGYQTLPTHLQPKCVGISQANYLRLVQFIHQSFQLDAKGQPIQISNGGFPSGSFYEAVGNYSVLRHCNAWTVESLRTAGINTPHWATLPSAILSQLDSRCD